MAKLSVNDLNDFLSPGAVCIKPAQVKKQESKNDIRIDGDAYYEVTKDTGETSELGIASISLNDCLACSGCITSAETVLVNLQSYQEVLKHLESRKSQEILYVSLSPQVRANLAAYYGLSLQEIQAVLEMVFIGKLGFHAILDTNASREIVLQQCAQEFCNSWLQSRAHKNQNQVTNSVVNEHPLIPHSTSQISGVHSNTSSNSGINENAVLPILSSSCPGWICYVEKTHSNLIPNLSRVRSPQQACGRILKDWAVQQFSMQRNDVWHLSLMPCFDKKLEASRDEFSENGVRDVDSVLTPKELVEMFKFLRIDPIELTKNPIPFQQSTDAIPFWYPRITYEEQIGSSSGGYMGYVLSYAAKMLFGIDDVGPYVSMNNKNGDLTEYTLRHPETNEQLISMATCYGFRNIQNLVRRVHGNSSVRKGRVLLKKRVRSNAQNPTEEPSRYDYVEVMACPGGCINGGGQLPFPSVERIVSARDWMQQVEKLYYEPGTRSVDQSAVSYMLEQWVKDPTLTPKFLHTSYRAVQTDNDNPLLLANKW
ncbi:CIA machinery iron hydrogenase Nar1 [Schizosaccharomyces pombe]|uniref:Cytosolic Fe-S cluster assembly factor NAR1 homolog n=1 Tax=Schizosaccharomyces pombe (strain 972 / ATCC 24843) TaxID=284812 RepID=NAR1_SCHPO|nr:putative iron hydrogenase [Schizosaccharomyces pombe]Q9Y7N7.1 RecName: Full=Cytosolic Fe-S cluster assembly factor NAR1 homolog; AltName: Full=Nuclear architecture-related protein 1 homolog [Schizosaccharomyces pombe 972h-]CAB40177.1 iron hydrogenase (predicted) [Schizosaccharomyces pombe]|eukprot:NP_588309.1 putative iron hydrogenase [Schizosaccharomyces pombe]